jgi:EmrB/QacA subfamily drug resistance transporter
MTAKEAQMSTKTTPYARRWQALIVLAMSLLIVSVDNTILNVALPTIREELDANSSQLQWVVDGYLLAFAVLLLIAGSLGDRFGRKKALAFGLVVFGVGSVLAAAAPGTTQLIASRALMGIGAAAIMPTTLSILTNIFPEDERPKAIAIWAAVAGMGIAIGPTTGGWLIESYDWSWIFLVNIPVVVAALVGAYFLIPESRDPQPKAIDYPGAALSIAGLTAIVWGLIEASERGWTDSKILGAFAVGSAVVALFVMWERKTTHPMLDVTVFRNLRFSAASLAVGFVFFALMGVVYFLTTYLQSVMGYKALEAGVRMLPVAAGMISATRLSVVLTEKIGTKIVVAIGMSTVAAALYVLSTCGVDTGYDRVAIALGMLGMGMALAMSPATESIMGSLPKAKAGIGSAMNDVVRELGGTLGVAVLGSVLASGYGASMDGSAVAGLPPEAAEAASDSVGGAHDVAAQIGGEAAVRLTHVADSAFVDAMSTTATLASAVALLGALIALLFLPSRARASAPEAITDEALPQPAAA